MSHAMHSCLANSLPYRCHLPPAQVKALKRATDGQEKEVRDWVTKLKQLESIYEDEKERLA